LIVGLASIGGVETGKMFFLYLKRHGLARPYIRIAYIIILFFVTFFMLREYSGMTTWKRKTEQQSKMTTQKT